MKGIQWYHGHRVVDSVKSYYIYDLPEGMVAEPGSFTGTPQELAALIVRQITTYPETHNQDSFIDGNHSASGSYRDHGCKTTMCVAGWISTFVQGKIASREVVDVAMKALDITEQDAQTLFYHTNEAEALQALQYLAEGRTGEFSAFLDDFLM